MRIGLLTKRTLIHGLGGVEVHAEGLVRELRSRGHEIVVLSTASPREPQIVRGNGLEVHCLPNTPSGVYSRAWFRESVASLERFNRERAFDVILSEGIAGSALVRRLPEIPHLAFLHGLALEHVVSHFREIEGVKSALKYSMITIPELLYYAIMHEFALIRRATMLGVVSRRTAAQIKRWYRVPERVVRFLPNWVDVDRFRPDASGQREVRALLQVPQDAFMFLVASILTKQKGVHIALEAFSRCRSRHSGAVLVVVGDGPYRPQLEAKARALQVWESARFVGEVTPSMMPRYARTADAFLFPTLRMESTGIVLLEAMASALPVIASRIAAVPEVVGDAGLLVPPGDTRALLAAMLHLIENPDHGVQMGEAARERVERLYAKTDILTRIEATCLELAESRR